MTEAKTYLITGGTGFLGSTLVTQLLASGNRVRSYSRNEHSLERLSLLIPPSQKASFSPLLGAVEDRERLERAMRGVDYVIHTAAQKIVPIAEYDPSSCIHTNVIGTENVALACIKAGVKRAVFTSTDKASAPATLYGATKLCAERSWLGANRYSAGKGTEFAAVRYGNCWGSRGSVLEAWAKALREGKPLVLTDPKCTRFHILLSEAVAFVLSALEHAAPGDLLIPKLPTYRIGDLCMAFRLAYGVKDQPAVTGLRLAEKLHEDLISTHESMACREQDEGKYVLVPGRVLDRGGWGYSSGQPGHQLGVEELTRMVELWKGTA